MIRMTLCIWVAVFAAASASFAGAAQPARPVQLADQPGGFTSTHIIVKFAACAMQAPLGAAAAHRQIAPGSPAGMTAELGTVCSKWGMTKMQPVYPLAFRNPQAAAQLGLDRMFVVEVPQGTDTQNMAKEFAAFGGEVEAAGVDVIGTVAQVIPTDPDFSIQYGLNNTGQTGGTVDADIDAPEAWEIHAGDPGAITVAVVDTGVFPQLEFEGRLVPGINTVGSGAFTTNTTDDCTALGGHGTHVAGIVAAGANNGVGMVGVAFNANIMPVRVFNGCGGNAKDTAEGMMWAVDNGADIISISLQFPITGTGSNDPALLEAAVDYAHANDVLVISATGNNNFCGNGVVCVPARFTNSVAVAATGSTDSRASFSNSGPQVDLAAPGVSIWSTGINGVFHSLSGTSMATPHVSGLAALIRSYAPSLTTDEVRLILTDTADDVETVGFDNLTGFGRINAHSALLAAQQMVWARIDSSSPPDGTIDARQPSLPNGGLPDGYRSVDMVFSGDTAGMSTADFTVTQVGGATLAPFVVGILPDAGFVKVLLSGMISLEAWTTITHTPSGTSVTIAHLPGDVDGNGMSDASDVTALIDSLTGVTGPLPLYSTDIDRSGVAGPADILRAIDLLKGADLYDVYEGVSLPTMP